MLRKLQADANETIDTKERRQKEDILRVAALEGQQISVDIGTIELKYRLLVQRARNYLEEAKRSVDERINGSRKALQELVVDMMSRRADSAKKKLEAFTEDTPEKRTKRQNLGKTIFGDQQDHSKDEIIRKIEQEKNELEGKQSSDFNGFNSSRDELEKHINSLDAVLIDKP